MWERTPKDLGPSVVARRLPSGLQGTGAVPHLSGSKGDREDPQILWVGSDQGGGRTTAVFGAPSTATSRVTSHTGATPDDRRAADTVSDS